MIKYNLLKADNMINTIVHKEKITYRKLSELLGISTRFLNYFMKNERKSYPLYEKIEKLYYQLDNYYLIGYVKQSQKILFFYEIYDNEISAKNNLQKHINSNENMEVNLDVLSNLGFTKEYLSKLRKTSIKLSKVKPMLTIINFNNVYNFAYSKYKEIEKLKKGNQK